MRHKIHKKINTKYKVIIDQKRKLKTDTKKKGYPGKEERKQEVKWQLVRIQGLIPISFILLIRREGRKEE